MPKLVCWRWIVFWRWDINGTHVEKYAPVQAQAQFLLLLLNLFRRWEIICLGDGRQILALSLKSRCHFLALGGLGPARPPARPSVLGARTFWVLETGMFIVL